MIEFIENETREFRANYINGISEFYGKQYANIEEFAERTKNNYSKMLESTQRGVEYYKRLNKARKEYAHWDYLFYKKQHGYTKEQYVKDSISSYIVNFDSKVAQVADKLEKKGFDTTCKFNPISTNDAKLFEFTIEKDGEIAHGRSIWCAEESWFVTPHIRFIITTKKKK